MILFTVLLLSVLSYGHSSIFDNLQKCSLSDETCFLSTVRTVFKEIAEKGIPELNIPPTDPMDLKDISVSVMDFLKITLVKGTITGIGTCLVDKLSFDLTKGHGIQVITCSKIKVEGDYSLYSNNPLIKTVFGYNTDNDSNTTVTGDGHGKATFDKLRISFDYPLYAQKRPDGEIYFYSDPKRTVYDYKILGGAKFSASSIKIGGQEVSKQVVPVLNENWPFIISGFGKPFFDKAWDIIQKNVNNFFDTYPASKFVKDDLSAYARS